MRPESLLHAERLEPAEFRAQLHAELCRTILQKGYQNNVEHQWHIRLFPDVSIQVNDHLSSYMLELPRVYADQEHVLRQRLLGASAILNIQVNEYVVQSKLAFALFKPIDIDNPAFWQDILPTLNPNEIVCIQGDGTVVDDPRELPGVMEMVEELE